MPHASCLFHAFSTRRPFLYPRSPYPKTLRAALQFARWEAGAYASAETEPEHLLLGLLRASSLVKQQVAPGAIQAAIDAIDAHAGHGRGREVTPFQADPPLSQASRQMLQAAGQRAAERGQPVSALHLLLALSEDRSGVLASCMDALRIDRQWVEARLP